MMKISAEFQNLGIQNTSLGISGLLEVEPSLKKQNKDFKDSVCTNQINEYLTSVISLVNESCHSYYYQ